MSSPLTKLKIHSCALMIGFILLLGAAFLWLSSHLLWGEWSFDQGHNLLIARLMDYGYQPYTDIFMDRPPLFFWSIGPSYSFFQSVEGVQLVMMAYGLLAIAAVISIGVSIQGRLAGLLAGAFFAFNFLFFSTAFTVVPEIPTMSLGLISLALALKYHTSGKQLWLVTSGLLMGGSLLMNYFMPWLIPLVLLTITIPPKQPLSRHTWKVSANRNQIARNWLLWGGATLLIAFGGWLFFDTTRVLEQAILFHLNKTSEAQRDILLNLNHIWNIIATQPILSLCGLLGFGWALVTFKQRGWVMVIWLGLATIFLLLYFPLRSKHLIILVPIFALLAALGITYVGRLGQTLSGKSASVKWAFVAGSLLLLGLITWELFTPYKTNALTKQDMVNQKMAPLVTLLKQFTSPSDCLITDNPYLAFVADRLPPPWIANLSYARFTSGSITTQNLVDITQSYNCQVMAPVLDRIKNSDRAYYDWAKGNYITVWVLDGKEIMLGKPLAKANPAIPLNATFADQVQLTGADWQPGQHGGHISLYWHTLRPFDQNYKIFVQLRDAAGQTVSNADHEAFNGLIPTQFWPVNAIFKETNRLAWPTDVPPGSYTIYVGLYHPATGERLPITNDASGENAVIIPGIEIK